MINQYTLSRCFDLQDFMDISEAPAPSMAEDESPPHPAIQV